MMPTLVPPCPLCRMGTTLIELYRRRTSLVNVWLYQCQSSTCGHEFMVQTKLGEVPASLGGVQGRVTKHPN